MKEKAPLNCGRHAEGPPSTSAGYRAGVGHNYAADGEGLLTGQGCRQIFRQVASLKVNSCQLEAVRYNRLALNIIETENAVRRLLPSVLHAEDEGDSYPADGAPLLSTVAGDIVQRRWRVGWASEAQCNRPRDWRCKAFDRKNCRA